MNFYKKSLYNGHFPFIEPLLQVKSAPKKEEKNLSKGASLKRS